MKEKMKKFFTLTKRANAGFTLVELIVVIAILAILAGVGVPAYSAYVTKANKQADITLVSEVVSALQVAHYAEALDGAVTVILQKDGALEVEGDTDDAEAWARAALANAFGDNYASVMGLQYDGWGNGVAVTQVMLDALQNGNYASAMENVYGDAGNLSFTEEIPALMDEVKSIATEVAGGDAASDEDVIGIVTSAAAVTSQWDVSTIHALWRLNVGYNTSSKSYTGVDSYVAGASAFDAKLTIAGVLRAKNTCLALYASQNGYPQYYDKLASFSVSDTSILPLDLTLASSDPSVQARLCTVLGLDPVNNSADNDTLTALAGLLAGYYGARDVNGNEVYKNDATAYAAMMGIVDGLATDENSPLSSNDVDEYFNAVSGPVSLFQQLVTGTADINTLTTSLSGVSTTGSNVSITLIPNGYELEIIVGPTTVLG